MNKKKLIDKILENWTAKVICLVLAIFLYVFHQVSLLERKTLTVPLTVESDGVMMPFSEIPKFVKVSVRSSKDILPTIYSSGFKAVLNLSNYTEKGTYQVPVSLHLSEGLILTNPLEFSVKPEILSVELDEKIVKYIPIVAATSGNTEHGYVVKNIDISPASVKVTGPATIVNKTKNIYTKKVLLSGAAKSFSQEVKLDNHVQAIAISPESDFRVTVNVVPADSEKVYKNLPVVIKNLSEELILESTFKPVTIKVAGTVPVLDKFNFGPEDVAINLSEIKEPGTYELPLEIKLPSNIAVIEKPEENFVVKLTAKPKPQPQETILEPVIEEKLDSVVENVPVEQEKNDAAEKQETEKVDKN